jgi:hypothetical protein
MVVSGDRLYVLTKSGETVVFAAKPKFEVLASNNLGDSTNGSIAVSDGELFMRTSRFLWCIRGSSSHRHSSVRASQPYDSP